jgi:hypothetical protein
MVVAGRPARPGPYFARVRYDQSQPPMTASRRVDVETMPRQSKSEAFFRLRRRRQVHTVGRRGTVEARRNLPLNPLIDRATVRACSFHHPDHLPLLAPACTVWLTSTLALKPDPEAVLASSSAGGSGVRLPGGYSVADNHFDGVRRCAAALRARTGRLICPPADYSHRVSSPSQVPLGSTGRPRTALDPRPSCPASLRTPLTPPPASSPPATASNAGYATWSLSRAYEPARAPLSLNLP